MSKSASSATRMGQRAVRPPTPKDQKPCPPAQAGPRTPRSRAPLGPRPCKAPQRGLAPSNTTTLPPKVKGVTNCIRRSPKSLLVLSLPKEAESNGSSRQNQVKPGAVKLSTSRGPALFILPVLSLSKEAQRKALAILVTPSLPALPTAGRPWRRRACPPSCPPKPEGVGGSFSEGGSSRFPCLPRAQSRGLPCLS